MLLEVTVMPRNRGFDHVIPPPQSGSGIFKLRRREMNRILQDWGFYKVHGARGIGFKSIQLDDEVHHDGVGYDYSGFSDHDCFMVHVDQCVQRLNQVDVQLLTFEYAYHQAVDSVEKWCALYERSEKTYFNRRTKAIDMLVELVF